MGSFVTVEHALLDHDHAVAVRAPIDDAGAYTTTGALTTGDEGINVEVVQMTHQRRAPEGTGRRFAQDGFPGQGRDLINNIVPVLQPLIGCGVGLTRWR